MMRFLAFMLALIVGCFLLLQYCAPTRAHDSWINRERLTDPVTKDWCCNEKDTREETANVRQVPGGYLIISTGEVIPRERVIWRSPGGWWRSRNLNDGSTRCLIGPPMGS